MTKQFIDYNKLHRQIRFDLYTKPSVIRKNNGRFASRFDLKQTRMASFSLLALLALVITGYSLKQEQVFVSPIASDTFKPIPTVTPYNKPIQLDGMASWYGTGESECLGCNAHRIMANGQKLDDTKKTIACGVGGSCKLFPLGSEVKIINLTNGMTTEARVTDTGGFTKYNRIADLSIATRNSLNASGNVKIRIILLK